MDFDTIKQKLTDGTLEPSDLPQALALFAHMANSVDAIRYEMARMTQGFQFNLGKTTCHIGFGGGRCTAGLGAMENPTVIFFIDPETVLEIARGNLHSSVAQMGGRIDYTGPRHDAIAFQRVFELFLDQFLIDRSPLEETDTSGKVKFGLIGAGGAFHFHSNGARESSIIAYTAVYDRDFEKAKKMAARHRDCRMLPYETLDEMLAADINAVLVMVPHAYHDDIVVQCARAGKHVLCEKPMGTTVEGCRRMIKACKDNGVKFMIAENHRFLPAHTKMHEIVSQGLIGEVLMIRAYEGVNEIAGLSTSGFWKGDPIKAGGGALMDMAAHKFAAIEYITGAKCTQVTAQLAKQQIPLPEKAEDNAMAIARFDNGAMADITVSFTQLTAPYNSMEIFGTKGTIYENHAWEKPVRFCSFDERMGENLQKWVEPEVEHAIFPEYYTISVRETDEHFARCILENKDPEFTPEQSMHAITGILAGYLSAIEGRPVETSEIEALADQGNRAEVTQILERLAPAVPINQNLEAMQMTEPVGYNRKRAARIMEEHNLDLLIAASPVNVYYLSGLPLLHCAANPILLALNNQYPNLAMIRREGEGTLIHWGVFRSAGRFSWMPDTVGIESQEECRQAVMAKIRQWGLAGKRVGVESTAPAYLLDALSAAGCGVTIPADGAFLDLRLVKTPLECEYLEKAALITEEALKKTIAAVKEGVTDLELLKIGRDAMLAAGAEDWDHLTLTIGDSDPEAPGTGRAVKAGEIVRLDFGAIYKGYVADVNQHVCVGAVPEKAKELITGLLEYQKKFEDAIAPGVNMKRLGEDVLTWYTSAYPHGEAFTIGHSIGLQCEDQHIFGALGALDRPFEPNMVFEIEAWQAFEGALIGVEDAYVVTETGCRKLTTMEKTIIEV